MILETLFDKKSRDCFIPIDLSDENSELTDDILNNPVIHEQFITDFLNANNKSIAYGGYLEVRNLYKRSKHFNKEGVAPRNIHLGIDCWCSAETPVFTPIDGKVHSFNVNADFGNYGPTIILEHVVNGNTFYTLYGHLSKASLLGLCVGQNFKKGTKLATLGDHTVNGNYAPHLHFQLILNIGEYKGDYPGVCALNELDYYKNNCPDPLSFLVLPQI